MIHDVQTIADLARAHDISVAVAESLTSGAVSSRLGAGPDAAEWFRGGIVAYSESVKFNLLGVTPGPLVTERCAQQMARAAGRLLEADIALGVTGVGGPEPSEGNPAGTVIMAVAARREVLCRSFRFRGSPEDVISATVDQAIAMIAESIRSSLPAAPLP